MDDALTREQLATILYRYAKYKGCDVSDSADVLAYSDGAKTSGWALEAVQWACGAGVLDGADGGLRPTEAANRAEIAKAIRVLMENAAR